MTCSQGPDSVLTYEKAESRGQQQIMEKMSTLNGLSREARTFDAMQGPGGSLIVLITGQCAFSGERAMNYNETFVLVNTGGAWCIKNQIFSLNIG